jgi:hypothetical protein
MYFNLISDFEVHAKEELKQQVALYKKGLQNDEPFSVLKSIQSNIKYLRELINEQKTHEVNEQNTDRIF